MSEVRAHAKYVGVSAQKARRIVDLVRGRQADQGGALGALQDAGEDLRRAARVRPNQDDQGRRL